MGILEMLRHLKSRELKKVRRAEKPLARYLTCKPLSLSVSAYLPVTYLLMLVIKIQ